MYIRQDSSFLRTPRRASQCIGGAIEGQALFLAKLLDPGLSLARPSVVLRPQAWGRSELKRAFSAMLEHSDYHLPSIQPIRHHLRANSECAPASEKEKLSDRSGIERSESTVLCRRDGDSALLYPRESLQVVHYDFSRTSRNEIANNRPLQIRRSCHSLPRSRREGGGE